MISDILNKTQNDICFNIKNAYQCADFLNNITLPADYIIVSLDVKNLFPSIPLNLVVKAIEERWSKIKEDSGIFYDSWKTSFMTPIFKCGNRFQISNYRGIAILNCIPKLFEKIVVKNFLEKVGHLINEHQHGFIKNKSTITNLTCYSNILRQSIVVKNGQVDSIYTDFKKAFDRVDHSLLIFKLEKMGIRGNILKWIESYLTNRKQIVRFQNEFSIPINVTSGVPQGSHIGPVLFNLFINDLSNLFNDCNFLFYADDLKLYKNIKSHNDRDVLQANLNVLNDWCSNNGMELNIKKCNVITFSKSNNFNNYDYHINNSNLDRVNTIKDLGIYFDPKLKFLTHIDKTFSSGMCMLGFIKRRAKEFNNPYLTKMLFCSVVRPILEYGNIVWNPNHETHFKKIESVQKQFLLFALKNLGWNSYHLPPYKHRLLLINMTTLASRFELASCLFIFDLLRNKINCPTLSNKLILNTNTKNLRNTLFLSEIMTKDSIIFNDTINLAIRNFNKYQKLYNNNISRETFKNKILDLMKIVN
jgi:hypothetical protein